MTFPLMPMPQRRTKATVAFIGPAQIASDLTTYTFADTPIGPSSGGRLVVIVVAGRAGAGRTISGVTIAGVAASVAITSGSQSNPAGIYYAAIPGGTTADVVVTFSGAMLRAAVSVYTIEGHASAAPISTAQDFNSTTTLSVTLNRGVDAVVIAGSLTSSAGTYTWTGLTENVDADIEAGSGRVSSASGAFAAADPAMAVSFVNTSSGAVSLTAACWA